MNTNENNESDISTAKQYFWNFLKEIYVLDSNKNVFYYISLINEINDYEEKNHVFKDLTKNEIFFGFFNETLNFISFKFEKNHQILFSNAEEMKMFQIFNKKYSILPNIYVENLSFELIFPLLKIKPIFSSIKEIKEISFLLELERKNIRKDFKNFEVCLEFLKELNNFLENCEEFEEIKNYVYQAISKIHKYILFSSDLKQKITKSFGFLVEILSFWKLSYQINEKNKKFIDMNSIEQTISDTLKLFKKSLKSFFWSDFNSILAVKKGKKKNKKYEVADEQTYEDFYCHIFIDFYKSIKQFLNDKNQSLNLLELSFVFFLKVFCYH